MAEPPMVPLSEWIERSSEEMAQRARAFADLMRRRRTVRDPLPERNAKLLMAAQE